MVKAGSAALLLPGRSLSTQRPSRAGTHSFASSRWLRDGEVATVGRSVHGMGPQRARGEFGRVLFPFALLQTVWLCTFLNSATAGQPGSGAGFWSLGPDRQVHGRSPSSIRALHQPTPRPSGFVPADPAWAAGAAPCAGRGRTGARSIRATGA